MRDFNLDDENQHRKSILEPVKKVRLYESIVQQLQKLILDGTLTPGEKLPPERELAQDLDVSRPSIREALRALEMMGYLETRVGVGGGTFIKEVTFSNRLSPFSGSLLRHYDFILELLEARLVLELEVVRLAALRRSEQDLAKLKDSIEHMATDIGTGGTGYLADNEFHKVLAEAANNRVLNEFVSMCGDLLEAEREEHLRTQVEGRRVALEQHSGIYDAVFEQDSERAQRIMQDHLLTVEAVIKSNRGRRSRSDTGL